MNKNVKRVLNTFIIILIFGALFGSMVCNALTITRKIDHITYYGGTVNTTYSNNVTIIRVLPIIKTYNMTITTVFVEHTPFWGCRVVR